MIVLCQFSKDGIRWDEIQGFRAELRDRERSKRLPLLLPGSGFGGQGSESGSFPSTRAERPVATRGQKAPRLGRHCSRLYMLST